MDLELPLAAAALGVAGIDPAGMVLAIGALVAGARERGVVGFAAVVVLGTALLGTVLSVTVGQELRDVDWASFLPPDGPAAVIELVIAAALLAWAAVRLRRPDTRPPRPHDRGRSGRGLLAVGLLFALSAPLDPTFVGLVVLAGRDGSTTAVAGAHLVWILVSQAPLVALTVAMLAGRHAGVVAWARRVLPRVRPLLARLGTAALALTGAVLALDAGWWVVTGRFLLPDPT